MPELAVLLRDGPHNGANTIRYALKASDVAISISKTPIQIPIPQQSPEIVDIGYFRPSITVTGLIDAIGGNPANTGTGVSGMASFLFTRASVHSKDGGSSSAQTYYIPYKNALEEAAVKWIFSSTTALELEVGDAKYPIDDYSGFLGASGSNRFTTNDSTQATGGAIYKVAIQQARFQLNAGREDRYDFSLQLVAQSRIDVP